MGNTTRTAWSVPLAAALVALVVVVGAIGCGGSDDPAYCADRAALEQSLKDLGDVNVGADGLDALTEQLRTVGRDAGALVDSARDEFGAQASALRSSLARLEDSARAAIAAPSAERVSAVAADASDVAASFGELSDAIGSRC